MKEMKKHLQNKNQVTPTDIEPHEMQELHELVIIIELNKSNSSNHVPFLVCLSSSISLKSDNNHLVLVI